MTKYLFFFIFYALGPFLYGNELDQKKMNCLHLVSLGQERTLNPLDAIELFKPRSFQGRYANIFEQPFISEELPVVINFDLTGHVSINVGVHRLDGGVLDSLKYNQTDGGIRRGVAIQLLAVSKEEKQNLIKAFSNFESIDTVSCSLIIQSVLQDILGYKFEVGKTIWVGDFLKQILKGKLTDSSDRLIKFRVLFTTNLKPSLSSFLDWLRRKDKNRFFSTFTDATVKYPTQLAQWNWVDIYHQVRSSKSTAALSVFDYMDRFSTIDLEILKVAIADLMISDEGDFLDLLEENQQSKSDSHEKDSGQ